MIIKKEIKIKCILDIDELHNTLASSLEMLGFNLENEYNWEIINKIADDLRTGEEKIIKLEE